MTKGLSARAIVFLAVGMFAGGSGWPAMAVDGFTTLDLGSVDSEAECVLIAERTLQKFPALEVQGAQAGEWVVIAFDFWNDDDYDAVIACAHGPDGTTRATLVVHGAGNSSAGQRRGLADNIKKTFEQEVR